MKKIREWKLLCESGKYGSESDFVAVRVNPYNPTRASVYVTEADAAEIDGEPCYAEADVRLSAKSLRRLARYLEEAADDVDRLALDQPPEASPESEPVDLTTEQDRAVKVALCNSVEPDSFVSMDEPGPQQAEKGGGW